MVENYERGKMKKVETVKRVEKFVAVEKKKSNKNGSAKKRAKKLKKGESSESALTPSRFMWQRNGDRKRDEKAIWSS